jgi:hypothetical protein
MSLPPPRFRAGIELLQTAEGAAMGRNVPDTVRHAGSAIERLRASGSTTMLSSNSRCGSGEASTERPGPVVC